MTNPSTPGKVSPMSTTTLPRTLVNQILRHAQQAAEDEVCGLIGSLAGRPTRLYPVANIASDRSTLFEMEPKAQIDAMRQMRERGEELFAIYHSHPHAPAQPSVRDMQEASYPDALYLIISLNTEGVLEMRAFRFTAQGAEPVDLAVEES